MFNDDVIGVKIGDEMVLVDSDIFHDVFNELADRLRSEGLTGHALDVAIATHLRPRLAGSCMAMRRGTEPCQTIVGRTTHNVGCARASDS